MSSYLLCNLIDLMEEEVALFVKVRVPQGATSNHAIGDAPSSLHHQAKHLVVRLAREHDAAGAQLV